MKIVNGVPPNFEQIAAAFPMARLDGTIFAYGDTVYVIGLDDLPPHLRAHEAVHLERQRGDGPQRWWQRYIADVEFRLAEEIVAHRSEYGAIRSAVRDRNAAHRHLLQIAGRLASPLYGNLVNPVQARQLICAKG